VTPVKVAFVSSWSRSGSTLLDLLLGRLPGFWSAGEIRYLWDRGLLEDQLCGCGRTFASCPTWSAVREHAFGGRRRFEVGEALRGRHAASRRAPWRLLVRRSEEGHGRGRYPSILARLYPALREVTGARVIVDSSKYASHGLALASIPEVELHVVHLVRDARAVAWSWQRRKALPEIHWARASMPRKSPSRSALFWALENLAIARLRGRAATYTLLRYEDLVADPAGVLGRVLQALGEPPLDTAVQDAHTVDFGENHTVAGNPIRFRRGPVEIRADAEWEARMPVGQRALVTGLTWPLLWRYGFLGRNRARSRLPSPAP
jgi:hypothetical protein